MTVPPTLDLQGLLAEDQWIRRLARKLAGDAHSAEELAQETWVAALGSRQSAATPRALRPWLAGIVRHAWADLKGARAARDRRERLAARDEAVDSGGELVAELELRKRVADALLALEEPYRRALTLRFFRDQSLAAIAQREGIAVSTAHERVQHGLSLLRKRLDRDCGGRRAWAVGLFALAEPSRWPMAATEAMAMASGLKLAASILVVGGGVAWWWSERRQERALDSHELVVAREEPSVEPDGLELAALDEERLALQIPADAAERPRDANASPSPALAFVRGRVIDRHGTPQGGVAVGWTGAPKVPAAESAADGSFQLEDLARPAGADVHSREPGFITLVAGEPRGGHDEEVTVVVAASAAFAGVVLDAEGAPVAGARLAFRVRDVLFRELGLQRGSEERASWRASTDVQGRFQMSELAGGERVFLQAEAEGFFPAEVELPVAGASNMVVVLERNARGLTIRGIVLDALGSAVEGARVSAGNEIVSTDADGRFELVTHAHPGPFERDEHGTVKEVGLGPSTHLSALKAGLLPARELLADLDLDAPVILRLGARPASISGKTVDREGRPRAGVIVWLRDPTPFGRDLRSMSEGVTVAWDQTIEDELVGGYGKRGAQSDEHGAFELGGLIAREYELMAFDPRTAELAGPWTIAAHSRDVELVLPRAERRGRVAGRVVSTGGRPLADVSVIARRSFEGKGAHAEPPWLEANTVATDAEGRFEFAELALDGTQLLLQDEPFFMRTVALSEHADPAHLELVEPLQCELQVDLGGSPDLADALRVLDGDGRELETIESFGNGWSLGTEASIVGGLSSVVLIDETAETLVLYKDGVEVLRRTLSLDPDARTTVRP